VLGSTREEVRRSKKIAGISSEARAAARKCELDDNQAVLLKIAALPTPTTQLKAVIEIDERICAARARRASALAAADDKSAVRIKKIETNIAEKQKAVDELVDGLAADRKKLTKLEERLVADYVETALDVPTVDSPPTAPTKEPGELHLTEEQFLSAEDEAAFATLMSAWHAASSAVRKRFAVQVLRTGDVFTDDH
jgi:uncharacterized coiled-coil protein SlyX